MSQAGFLRFLARFIASNEVRKFLILGLGFRISIDLEVVNIADAV